MCGIFGFSWEDRGLLASMQNSLKHRGPDGSGKFIDNNISLGHVRLSIVGKSEKSKQPLFNEDRSLILICNGEIYNYKELKEQLKNHRFITDSDNEVILHLYEEKGLRFADYLEGMFAFALYDTKKKKLIFCRDRFGVKPLYYYIYKGDIIFASEIKALLKFEEIPKKINPNAVTSYLSLRYNIYEETFFKGIKKFRPSFLYEFKEGILKCREYWRMEFSEKEQDPMKLRQLLENSIKKRTMGDLRKGVFLSGGIDSSAIAYFLSKYEKISTFSAIFDEDDEDAIYSRMVAEKFSNSHKEISIDEKALAYLKEIACILEEPISDPSAIPLQILSKEVKKAGIRIMFSGDGSDEIMGGYEQDIYINLATKIQKNIPSPLNKGVLNLSCNIYYNLLKDTKKLGDPGKQRLSGFIKSIDTPAESFIQISSIFTNEEIKSIYPAKNGLMKEIRPFFKSKTPILNQLVNCEVKTKLENQLLPKLDKITMYNSIESREAFLDKDLVSYISGLRLDLKIKGLNGKVALKKAMTGLLPDPIIKRKKNHFFVPIDKWLDLGLTDYGRQVLSNEKLKEHGLFDEKQVEQIFKKSEGSPLYYSRQLFEIITFQLWYDNYIAE